MSAVLMCDNCTELFSVNEKGWRELSERIPASESNTFNNGIRALHTCAKCAGGRNTKRPSLGGVRELEAGHSEDVDVTVLDDVDESDWLEKQLETEELKYRRLERENPPREKETVRQYRTRIQGLMKSE